MTATTAQPTHELASVKTADLFFEIEQRARAGLSAGEIKKMGMPTLGILAGHLSLEERMKIEIMAEAFDKFTASELEARLK